MNSTNALAHSSPLRLHCSMPRPPNRSRRKPRRATFLNPSISDNPSSSSSSSFSSSDSSDPNFHTVIDLSSFSHSNSKFRRFLASGKDAYRDLQTLIAFDDDRRLVVSCRRSTLRFAGDLVVYGCVFLLGFRVLFGLLRWVSKARFGSKGYAPVVRRDRSLGGKEVVVGTREDYDSKRNFGGLSNPLSSGKAKENLIGDASSQRVSKNWVRFGKRLPKWWPTLEQNLRSELVDKQEYQREADRLIRAMTDNRLSGKDIVEDDIIQLRRTCKISGVQVSFDTTNTRDSFYRTSVDYMLNVCGRAPSHSSFVQIDGEDVHHFIAGLAENIGLENTRAARIVSAAVAARTRSCFLQAWALEMQGRHTEAMLELSKICLILRIFPPEESSPEMEMVARGLEKHLKVEQREFLMNMLAGFCDGESQRSAAEALGLMSYPTSVGDQQ